MLSWESVAQGAKVRGSTPLGSTKKEDTMNLLLRTGEVLKLLQKAITIRKLHAQLGERGAGRQGQGFDSPRLHYES